jgi:hypothetical protein
MIKSKWCYAFGFGVALPGSSMILHGVFGRAEDTTIWGIILLLVGIALIGYSIDDRSNMRS